jgi:hypothetical protein
MPRFQHGQSPQFTQITDVLGNSQWSSQDAAAKPSRSYAVQQPPAGRGYLHAADVSSFWTESDGVSTHMGRYANNGRILLANSNQLYFNNLVKIPCHKTPYRCPHRLSLSSQSSRSCTGLKIKALKDKGLEFANSIRSCGSLRKPFWVENRPKNSSKKSKSGSWIRYEFSGARNRRFLFEYRSVYNPNSLKL